MRERSKRQAGERPDWLLAARLGARNGLWFTAVYAGADAFTACHSWRVRVDLPIEQAIPFVPAMTLAYLSIYALILLAPLVLRSPAQLRSLACDHAWIITLAGIGFLLLPAELNYPPPGQLGIWSALFNFADRVNLTYNLVPSLHVALAVACVRHYVVRAGLSLRVALWSWAGLIALSTLLTHQHHLLDVVTGWGLALVVTRHSWRLPVARE